MGALLHGLDGLGGLEAREGLAPHGIETSSASPGLRADGGTDTLAAMRRRFFLSTILLLGLLGIGCGREGREPSVAHSPASATAPGLGPRPWIVDWLRPGAEVHRERERFAWQPDELSDPWSRGFAHGVEHTGAGRAFAWSLAPRSLFHLETLTPGPRTLVLDGFPYRHPGGRPQTVEVLVGGRSMGTLAWTKPARQEMSLPAGAVVPGRNELILRYGYTSATIEPDTTRGYKRELAMAWQEIALLPSGGTPAQPDVSDRGPSSPQNDSASEALSPDAEREQNVAWRGDGTALFEGPSIGWRWTTIAPGAVLESRGQATTDDTRLAVVIDEGSRTWTILDERALASGQGFDLRVPLPGATGTVARVGVVVYEGSIRFETLRAASPGPEAFTPRPVVLVTLDTTRRDALGLYAPDTPSRSPALDALGAKGVIFDRAYCPAPATGPSHASLLLSRYPHEHGLKINGHPLPIVTGENLAAQLQAWGYQTAAFVSIAVLAGDTAFGQEFDEFDAHFDQGWWRFAAEANERALPWIAAHPFRSGDPPWFLWIHYPDPHSPYGVKDEPGRGLELELDGAPLGGMATMGLKHVVELELTPGRHTLRLHAPTTAADEPREEDSGALREGDSGTPRNLYISRRVRVTGDGVSRSFGDGWEWVRGYRRMGAQAFLFVDVEPLGEGDEAKREVELELTIEDVPTPAEARRRYADEIAAMDDAFGRLLAQLEQSGWLDDGVILVAADHGEDLGEGGHFGHVEHLGPTLSRIPMLLFDPRIEGGRRLQEPVDIVDVAPTLFARLGLPPCPTWRGVDALHAPAARPLYLETFPPEAKQHWRGVVQKQLFVQGVVADSLASPDADQASEPLQLFDVVGDPDCRMDLAAKSTTVPEEERTARDDLSRMASLWLEWIDSQAADTEEDRTPDPRMIERLRALGYVR
jgi:arylsulfatase A-like enzyme